MVTNFSPASIMEACKNSIGDIASILDVYRQNNIKLICFPFFYDDDGMIIGTAYIIWDWTSGYNEHMMICLGKALLGSGGVDVIWADFLSRDSFSTQILLSIPNFPTGDEVTPMYLNDNGFLAEVNTESMVVGSANQLTTARTISLSGDVSGEANFDGSQNITINATVANNSHSHLLDDISGIYDVLNKKSDDSHSHTISDIGAGSKYTNQTLTGNTAQELFKDVDAKLVSVNSNLSTHKEDTTSHITAAERTKWNAAEANQNAFSNIVVGATTISADNKTDTFTIAAGTNITLTPDSTNDKLTIAATDTGAVDIVTTGSGNAVTSASYDASTRKITLTKGATYNNYSLPSAGSSLGGVKTGGDVTINAGIITVNDDSHNHIIDNIDDLRDELNSKSNTGHRHDIAGIDLTNFPRESGLKYGSTIEDAMMAIDDEFYRLKDAEKNQNAFSNVKVGSSVIAADSKTDTIEFVAGTNVSLTADTTNDKMTINATDTGATAVSVTGTGNAITSASYDSTTRTITLNKGATYNNYSLPEAGVSLGGIKSGGVATISGGLITAISSASAAGKVTNKLTIGGKKFDGSAAVEVVAADLGLANAMHFKGTVSTLPATTTDYVDGDVILVGNKEYVCYNGAWTELGDESSFKVKQSTVSSPSASGNATAFIDTISQNANGAITVTKKNIPTATTSTAGIAKLHQEANCSTYTSDDGGATPAAVKKAVGLFSLVHGGTADGSILFNNSSSVQSGQPVLYWATVGANTPTMGFAQDQSDGTFVICSLSGTSSYKNGLAIGGGSGNLFWKGEQILTNTTKYAGSSSVGGAATSANKVNSSLIIKLNGGSTEGTNLFTFNGSAAKSINITPSAIGAAESSHGTHVSYGTSATAVGATASAGSASTVSRSDHTHSLSKSAVTTALGYTPPTQDTVYTHPSYTARTGSPSANATPAFGGTFTVSQITSDSTGHVSGATDRTITIPSTLSNGTGTAGLIKTTSTVTSSSGYTACPVISGVPYFKNTTYSAATASANGLMTSTMFTKLSNIAENANNYSHPTYTSKTSGLYKVTVDGTGHVSATAAVAKADITALGIPAQDTTYSNFVKSGSGAKAGLVPAPSTTAGTTKYLREDGTWQVPPDNNTTYSVMTAATSSAAGAAGLVPAPAAGNQSSFLRGDGTWATPTNTKNTAGSTNSSSKLFLIGATSQAANPQTYSHDTAYVGTDGCLYSNSTKVSVVGHNHTLTPSTTSIYQITGVGTMFTASVSGEVLTLTAGSAPTRSAVTVHTGMSIAASTT